MAALVTTTAITTPGYPRETWRFRPVSFFVHVVSAFASLLLVFTDWLSTDPAYGCSFSSFLHADLSTQRIRQMLPRPIVKPHRAK